MSASDDVPEEFQNLTIPVTKEGNGNKTIQDVLDKCGRIVIKQEKFNKELSEKQDKLMEKLESIQNDLKGRKENLQIPSIGERAKEEEAPTDTIPENIEPIISKSFVMKRVFKDVLNMRNGFVNIAVVEEHFGFMWQMVIYHDTESLFFTTYCLFFDPITEWDIVVDTEIKLTLKNGNHKLDKWTARFKSRKEPISGETSFCNELKYLKWDEIEEYLIDGNLEFEVVYKIKKMDGFYEEIRKFDESMKNLSDIILNVNEKKFYVSKLCLATHSPYFESLFLGKFEESNKSEIKLTGIDSDDFQKYLEILYFHNPIDEYNVEGILIIADMYDTQIVLQKCEEFLMNKSKKESRKKLEMSVRYNLKELKKKVISEIKGREDMELIIPYHLESMDHSVMAELLRKTIYELLPSPWLS